jgi:flagellar biogenesis protein FliO
METISQLLSIGFVLGLLAAVLWGLRRKGLARFGAGKLRLGGNAKGRLLELVESRALAPGHALHLVRVGDQAFVLAVHPGGCTTVESRSWREIEKGAEAGR